MLTTVRWVCHEKKWLGWGVGVQSPCLFCVCCVLLCFFLRVSQGRVAGVDGERAASVRQGTQHCSSVDQQPITEEEEEDTNAGEREGGGSTWEGEEETTRLTEWEDGTAMGGVRTSEHSFKPPSGTGVTSSVDSKVGDTGSHVWGGECHSHFTMCSPECTLHTAVAHFITVLDKTDESHDIHTVIIVQYTYSNIQYVHHQNLCETMPLQYVLPWCERCQCAVIKTGNRETALLPRAGITVQCV